MTKDELNNEYFEWMRQLVCTEKYSRRLSYRKLLTFLHNAEFVYIIDMDGNRSEDGIDLRYRFGYERRYEGPMIATYLDDRPCSILEMLIALAIRCEEHIMDDPDSGDRTGQWFWNMIENLGLGVMNDKVFDKNYVNRVISRFLNREYKRNGEGGLFTVKHCKNDLRSAEIWYQMCWYLEAIL
ncbi:hypothetical protein FACS1894171_1890 [Clostridia bacterium]|nr:hypothetical protein FACS1894171_1890 [Clostridia bacterium]